MFPIAPTSRLAPPRYALGADSRTTQGAVEAQARLAETACASVSPVAERVHERLGLRSKVKDVSVGLPRAQRHDRSGLEKVTTA